MRGPGSISYDSEGIATISAANDYDVAFLQGYAHARDRFFGMDITRRKVSGSLAALFGESQLADDVQARTLGLRRAAEATWTALPDETRGWLRSYADGVNYWLATNPLPPEYGALAITRADAWDPVDSIVVGKGLAFQLSFDLDIQPTIDFGAYQQAAAAAHVDAATLYFGDTHRFAPPDDHVSIPGFDPAAASATVAKSGTQSAVPAASTIDAQTISLARRYRNAIAHHPLIGPTLKPRENRGGSNWWVVGGANTASGKPILSNDPHLSLALPPVFIEQHLTGTDARYADALNVTGVSVPGAPGIIQGCNSRLCWGTTTNPLDVTDVYQETFKVNSYGLPYAIVHNGQDEPVQWVFNSFYVNQLDGTPNNVARDNSIGYLNGAITIVVPRRNNGPVVQIDGTSGLSIAYTGWGATFELECFRRINRAKNVADFENALTYFQVGSQNFSYADVDGNIAYYTSAYAPIREDLQTQNAPGGGRPPWLIRDGSGALKHDWLAVSHPQPNQQFPFEVLPASEMPHVVNPASGYVANANNDPVGVTLDNNPLNQLRPGGGLYYLNWNYSAYRMGRIDRALQDTIASGHKITLADMQHLQANNQLMDAQLVLPYLLQAYEHATTTGAWTPLTAIANEARIGDAYARLLAWDYSTPTGIQQGYDPGDNPLALPAPSQAEIDDSVAATIFAMWRSYAVTNTVDATLSRVGLGDYLPGNDDAYTSFKFFLDAFPVLQGKGASGLTFFSATGAPTPADARDFVLLTSLSQALDQLASDELEPAFGGSTDLADYRWGKLHRIVFEHPLGGPFNLPGTNAYPFHDLATDLPGVARSGGYDTVDAATHSVRAKGLNDFMYGSGPARRFVGEMTPTINAFEVIPGGQSGVLGSPFYANELGRWLTDNYHPLVIPAAQAQSQSVMVLNFHP